jgi:hypothetical protein
MQPTLTFYKSSFEDLIYYFEEKDQTNFRVKRNFRNLVLDENFLNKWGKFIYKESSDISVVDGKIEDKYKLHFFIIEDKDQKIYFFTSEPFSYNSKEEFLKGKLFFKEETELVKEFINDILKCQKDYNKNEKSHINIIIENQGNLSLKSFEIKSKEIDFKKHYNPNCKEFVDDLLERFGSSKGLFLLHGKPGTGKTSLLRWIITQTDKKIIYIPPDMTSVLSNPNFMKFLMNHPKSVLLVEDAETVLMKRVSGGSSAIQNILNLSDGLLSDMLEIQIVATFNTNIKDIDNALLRPGRLQGIYEFKELEDDIAKVLCDEMGVDFEMLKEKTLAEIFNFNDKFGVEKKEKKKKIGFL